MNIALEYFPLPNRDASSTIRGFVYQVDVTIARWLVLKPGQTLDLEYGEDIDLVSRILTSRGEKQKRLLEQVKRHQALSITLRTSEVLEAIAHFCAHRANNPNPSLELIFRFTTNTKIGRERPSPLSLKIPAIIAWQRVCSEELQEPVRTHAIVGIRDLLANAQRPSNLDVALWQQLQTFLQQSSQQDFLAFLHSFEWSTDYPDSPQIRKTIYQRIIHDGFASNSFDATERYERLFYYVFQQLCRPGKKELTIASRNAQLSRKLNSNERAFLQSVSSQIRSLAEAFEQLDLLLLTVAKTRKVQQDGIHFQNHRYMDINLAAFVKEEVLIRYDPADLGEVHVFYQDRFLCRAICAELSDRKVSLKEIEKARSERCKQVRAGLQTRTALVDRYVEIHHAPSPAPKTVVEPASVEARPRLKRYVND